jgi:hypothetical protein
MSSSALGFQIISVAKTLDPYRADAKISTYFGATTVAGHAGMLLSAIRKHTHLSLARFNALASEALIDGVTRQKLVNPWLESEGFIEMRGTGDQKHVACNVLDYQAILRAVAKFFDSLDPSIEERLVLKILETGTAAPTTKDDLLSALAKSDDEQFATTALDLAKGYKIVKVVEGEGISTPVVYSPLIWGDNISKAGKALSHLKNQRRALLLQLIESVRTYQGMPEQSSVAWCQAQGDPDLVDFAVGLGLLDRTEIVTKDGKKQPFLTTPHLYGELAVKHGKDVCDRVRLFLDSIRHGQHFGDWHTGKISDPVKLLSRLIERGSIGPCTAIGKDYVLVEKAGIVRVNRSSFKPGQYEMTLVQDDTVRLIRDIVAEPGALSEKGFLQDLATQGQNQFIPSEQTRGSLGEQAGPMREAEAEMLRNLRESF